MTPKAVVAKAVGRKVRLGMGGWEARRTYSNQFYNVVLARPATRRGGAQLLSRSNRRLE